MAEKPNARSTLADVAPRGPMKPANEALRVPIFDDEDDMDGIDLSKKPEGMDYQWKRYSYGGVVDDKHLQRMKRNLWVEVPAERHPERFGDDAMGAAIDGSRVLMERPMKWTIEARKREAAKAASNISTQEQRLQVATHNMMPRTKPNARRTYEQVEVPADDRGDPNDF